MHYHFIGCDFDPFVKNDSKESKDNNVFLKNIYSNRLNVPYLQKREM